MMTVFFDFQGVFHTEFLEQGETIRAEEYCETLGRMKEAIRRRYPHLCIHNNEGYRSFLLHQDNAPPHTSIVTLAKFGEWGIELLAHPPYSPDLAPCDFALFPKLKDDLRGRRFRNIEELQREARRLLWSYPSEFYEQCFCDLVTRWKKCSAMDGNYFEGAHITVSDEEFEQAEQSSDSSDED